MPHYHQNQNNDVSMTIAEREAELAALQSAFDEYISSSRELEEELDAELGKMQEKLAESAAANAALASQLEHLSPQLSALERAHAATKDRWKEEATLRRNAELRSEELQHKCRELEASLVHAREEQDALHEELAFRDSELEETRLELEVERERHEAHQQHQQQQNGAVVVALDASITEEERISDDFDVSQNDNNGNADYVKRLEDELEVVTEQLIETEQKLSKTQEELLEAQSIQEESLLLLAQQQQQQQQAKSHESRDNDSILRQQNLQEELTKSREEALEWQQRVQLVTEELALAREELGAAEEDVQTFGDKMDRARKEHREEVRRVQAELERAVTDRDAYRAELETLEGTLQATVEENVSLKQECENLQTALDHAKRDSASVVQELEEVNARFDQVKQEAERVGQERAARLVREELLQSHREEMKALQAQFQTLQAANADLQETVDVVETALAAERDKQHALDAAAPPSASSEVQEKLQSQLERTRDELLQKSQEVEMLKSSFEQRVVKAEKDVTRLEQELSKTRGKLAEAEANLIVIRREKERAAAAIPAKRGLTDDESRDDSGRNGITHRSRSMSPTSPERLEQRASQEHVKLKELQEEYDSLKKQHQMSQAHVKRLEEDLNTLQMQVFATNGEATVATQMSRISSTLASKQNAGDDLTDDRGGSDVVEQVIQSGDPEVMAEELRKVDKKSTQQREHNAQLLNKILSLQGNIQVCCRVRPLRMNEIQQGSKSAVEAFSETEVGCFDARANKWKSFGFDKVWGPDQSQLDVFQDVEPLALSVVDGYNACIFAYGQTGSGKTYTMEGLPDGSQHGISYRTIQKIFHLLNFRQQQQKAVSTLGSDNDGKTAPFQFSLQIGMLEIYNDEIYDLLSPVSQGNAAEKKREARLQGEKATLDIRQNADGRVEVPDLTKEPVNSIQDVMNLLKKGNSNRATACTNLNEHSSRSHMVLCVDVVSGLEGQPKNKGCLYLVDLAGSERVRRSQVEGDQLKEAGFINKSLSALGNVMEALDRKASHVPYRDSKLTYLLQDSLGGNSRTMMVVAVCPMDTAYDESVHALNFATRVRRIQLGAAQRNVTSKNLEETVKALTNEMKMLTKAKEKSEHQLHSLKRDNTRIQERLQTISKSRSQQQSDSKTLEVLRKNNQEMANRWQKEKNMREASAKETEKLQSDLERIQKQYAAAARENASLKKKLQEKETALKESSQDLRRAKDASSAATLRARTAQLVNNRNGGSSRPPAARSPTPSTPAAPAAAADPAKVREEVLALLEKYDKAKADRIDIIMEKFKGKENLLLEKMTQRYEGGVSSSLQKRSEIALARHKERMQKRKEQQEITY